MLTDRTYANETCPYCGQPSPYGERIRKMQFEDEVRIARLALAARDAATLLGRINTGKVDACEIEMQCEEIGRRLEELVVIEDD